MVKPHGTLNSEETAKNIILAILDTIPGFRIAREAGEIKEMAKLYRTNVLGYKRKTRKPFVRDAVAFYEEIGNLSGMLTNNRSYFKGKATKPLELLFLAIPGLVDEVNPDALSREEVEGYASQKKKDSGSKDPMDVENFSERKPSNIAITSMIIAGLTTEKRRRIEKEGTVKRFKNGGVIIHEGDEVDDNSGFYIILEGAVVVEKDNKRIWQLGKGDVFGETALEKNVPRTASIIADGPVEVLALNRRQYKDLISTPDFGEEINRFTENLDLVQHWIKNTSEKGFLTKFSTYATKHLASRIMRKKYIKGATVISEGDQGDKFFIIKSGTVSVCRGKDNEREKIATLIKGEFFGEGSLLRAERRNATIIADGDLEVLVLKKEDF